MRRAATAALLTLCLASLAGAALADSGMSVGLNQSRRIVLRGTAASVIISDPHVADVAMVDAHDMILLGRGYGATDVIVLDRAGHTLMDSRVVVSAPETGRVTIHHGGVTSEFACTPRCQSLSPPDGSAPSGASTTAATTTTNGSPSTPTATPGT